MVDVYGRPVGGVYGQTVGGLLADAGSDIYGYGQGLLDYIRRRPESAGLIAGQFAPGAATADFYGRYPDPMNPSQMLPSAGQNIVQGNILDAAFQSAGLLGDAFYAAAPFTAGAAAIPGAALSAPRAAQLALKAKKYSGLTAREDVPNIGSIGASLENYEVVPGIQEVKMADIPYTSAEDLFSSADDIRRSKVLAEKIKESGEINPLIIVEDDKGKYVLEGAHRLGALHELGVGSFPAIIVRDLDLVPSMRGAKTPKDAEPGIVAYHGSPFDFGEFSLRNINTGEGAQAFGHGLYFTDSEDIAKFYRDSVRFGKELKGLQPVKYKGRDISEIDDLSSAEKEEFGEVIRLMQTKKMSPEQALQARKDALARDLANVGQDMDIELADGSSLNEVMRRSIEIQQNALVGVRPKDFELDKGKIYKVGLAPKPDELLDYDKPFGEQNDFIKERLEKVANELNVDDAMNLGFDPFDYGGSEKAAIEAARKSMLDDETPVVRFLNDFAVLRGNLGAGEELLNKHGIKGVKYKSNLGVGARNVPEAGVDNYVIFDDKLVKILEKYGIFGPVAVGAATTAGVSGGLLGREQRQQENQLVPVF
jgi:hypothetical protein